MNEKGDLGRFQLLLIHHPPLFSHFPWKCIRRKQRLNNNSVQIPNAPVTEKRNNVRTRTIVISIVIKSGQQCPQVHIVIKQPGLARSGMKEIYVTGNGKHG